MSETTWRLLQSGEGSGAWNMAVDAALLEAVSAGAAQPTLRFYGWSPPCLSLGYFQALDIVDLDACADRGVDVVRRPTGGRAILHDQEVTYSLALPAEVLGQDHGILPSYHRISRGIQSGLEQLGVRTTLAPGSAGLRVAERGPICFDRPSSHEILLDGRKLVGSAQVRRGGALLQHGSILIEPRLENLVACLKPSPWETGSVQQLARSVIGLTEVGLVERAAIAQAVAWGIAREFGVGLRPGRLSPAESAFATAIMESDPRVDHAHSRVSPAGAQKATRTR
jgi:lipoate-protein ligase A